MWKRRFTSLFFLSEAGVIMTSTGAMTVVEGTTVAPCLAGTGRGVFRRFGCVERLYCKRPIQCLASSEILTPHPLTQSTYIYRVQSSVWRLLNFVVVIYSMWFTLFWLEQIPECGDGGQAVLYCLWRVPALAALRHGGVTAVQRWQVTFSAYSFWFPLYRKRFIYRLLNRHDVLPVWLVADKWLAWRRKAMYRTDCGTAHPVLL
jgi:hypothetical protein